MGICGYAGGIPSPADARGLSREVLVLALPGTFSLSVLAFAGTLPVLPSVIALGVLATALALGGQARFQGGNEGVPVTRSQLLQ